MLKISGEPAQNHRAVRSKRPVFTIDVLEYDGYVWLIMDYIQGYRLDQSVSRGITGDEIWSVALQLADVLVYLHTRKEPVYHLDIKPSNIVLRPNKSLVLLDFGASIRGHPQKEKAGRFGTRGFAAPEQCRMGETVGARADIYGAGAVLYYCCYGRAPKSVSGHTLMHDAARKKDRARLPQLLPVIEKCLEEEQQKRYEDSRQLYRAIYRAQNFDKGVRMISRSAGAAAMLALTVMLLFHSIPDEKKVNGMVSLSETSDTASFLEEEDSVISESITEESGSVISESITEESGPVISENITEESGSVISETITEKNGSEASEDMTEENSSEDAESITENPEMEITEDSGDILQEEQEYLRLLRMAGGMGLSRAAECYKSAMELRPADPTWYMQLLEQVTADGLYDQEEENVVKELIYAVQPESDMTALDFLADDEAAYGLFCYRMGLAYWYYYNGTGGKSAAAWWFQQALSTQENDAEASWAANARILARIGSYYGMLGITNAELEQEEKEWDYWKDLKELWYLYVKQQEEPAICCETAAEILSLLVLKTSVIQQYGESGEEIKEIMMSLNDFLQNDSVKEEEKEWQKLSEQYIAAQEAVDRTFAE